MKKIDVEIDSHHHDLHHLSHHQDLHRQVHDHHAEPFKITPSLTTTTMPTEKPASAASTMSIQEPPSYTLTIDKMNPIFQFKSKRTGNPKIINAHGLHHLVIILLTMPLWMIALEAVHALGTNIPGFDEDRGKFDRVGKIWCRVYLRLTNCYPIIDGDVGRLLGEMHKNNNNNRGGNNHSGDGNGPCLFVANHASFLDIAVLCCVLNPTFKFIAKDSLKNFPGVGRQLVGVSRGISFLCLSLLMFYHSFHTIYLLYRENTSLLIVLTSDHNCVCSNVQ
jgi:1-acyl-sn-glycerol-3-phosphate acyltransferase